MSYLLEMLLNGNDLDAALTLAAREMRIAGMRTNVHTFKVSNRDGFATTELYPNSNSLATPVPLACTDDSFFSDADQGHILVDSRSDSSQLAHEEGFETV